MPPPEDEFRVHEEDVVHQGPAQGNDGVLEDSVGYEVAGCRPADDVLGGNIADATGGGYRRDRAAALA